MSLLDRVFSQLVQVAPKNCQDDFCGNTF